MNKFAISKRAYSSFGITDTGSLKKQNDDRFLIKNLDGASTLLAVADGLSGQPYGYLAAEIALNVLDNFHLYQHNILKQLRQLIIKADTAVMNASKESPDFEYMGTTLTTAVVLQDKVYWAHVGDSRIYHIQHKNISQITIDQTMAQYLIEEGEITSEQAKNHPMKSLLDQCLGCGSCVAATGSFRICPGDIILLCSDGLFNEIEQKKLYDALRSDGSIKNRIEYLVKTAREIGGKDNITAVALELDSGQ